MEFPVQVALAQLVPTLPTGPRWWFEVKLDGHRTVLWRITDSVRLQARSGRYVTAPWMDLAVEGMALPTGVVLDGEAVVVVGGVRWRRPGTCGEAGWVAVPGGPLVGLAEGEARGDGGRGGRRLHGAPLRPRTLAVRLPDGRTALSQRIGARLGAEVAPFLTAASVQGRARTSAGDAYTAAEPGLTVEVLAGTTRHAVVTVTRLR